MKNILKERIEAGQLEPAEHPSADTLTAFVERSLKSAQRDSVLAHLALCAGCRDAVALASPELPEAAAIPGRASGLRFPLPMRWASVAAALAVAAGIGLLHERSVAPKQIAAAPSAMQAAAPPPEPQEPEKLPAKSQSADQTQARAGFGAAALKKNSRAPLPTLERKLKNDRRSEERAVMGGIAGGLLGRSSSSSTMATNGLVSSTQERSQEASVASHREMPASTTAALPSAPAPAGNAGDVQAFDTNARSAAASGQVASFQNAQPPLPDSAAVGQNVEVSAQTEQQQSATLRKAAPAVVMGGPMHGTAFKSFTPIAHWKISDAGILQRTSPDGSASSIEPAPGLRVQSVAAEGIEVWAAGEQPDPSAKHWQEHPVLFHSSDAGKTWTKIEGPWRTQIVRLSLAVGNLTVIAKDGIWSTINAGKSWLKR